MRNSAVLTLMLALCAAGCGGKSDPAPTASESSVAEATAASSEPAPAPTATPTPPETKLSGTAQVPGKLRAAGTEPFWGVQIDGATLVYTTPEDQKGQTIAATREDSSISSTWTGTLGGKKFEISIVPEKCSDGMSDTEYPFSAWLNFGGGMRHGCARVIP